jgi:predicted nucleotidyltransferase
LLDVLGAIEDSTKYEDLLPDASPLDVNGVPILVLTVERLIEVKRKLDRPKDRLMLLQLESLLEEMNRQR